jgi:hypothetical protein
MVTGSRPARSGQIELGSAKTSCLLPTPFSLLFSFLSPFPSPPASPPSCECSQCNPVAPRHSATLPPSLTAPTVMFFPRLTSLCALADSALSSGSCLMFCHLLSKRINVHYGLQTGLGMAADGGLLFGPVWGLSLQRAAQCLPLCIACCSTLLSSTAEVCSQT